jgi:hypothetical protein
MSDKKEVKNYPARFPIDLYEKIVKSAEENDRSIMGEIISRLKNSFNAE